MTGDDIDAVAAWSSGVDVSALQGATPSWEAEDRVRLRDRIPENKKLAYDVHKVIKALADTDCDAVINGGVGKTCV